MKDELTFPETEASAPPPETAEAGVADAERAAANSRVFAAAWGEPALALVDQAAVSGASFLTTIVLSRWTHASQLGVFAVGFSVIVTVLGVQESLITLPYTIRRHNAPGAKSENAGGALIQSALFSAMSFLLLAAAAVALWARGGTAEVIAMSWAVAATAPFALLREFARRVAFAHLDCAMALMLDLAVLAIQFAALIALAWTGNMSAAAACAALGGACAATGLAWLYFARAEFAFRLDSLGAAMRQSWGLGGWLLAGQITVTAQGYVAYWLLAAQLGATSTGVFAACMSVVSFANPLISGLGNILMPRAVQVLKQGGLERLRRQILKDSLLLGLAMFLFCAVVLFTGAEIMHLLFPTKTYEGQSLTLTVLALGSLATAVGFPASNALAAMERPRAIVGVGLLAVGVTVGLFWELVPPLGLLGAALAVLAGNLAGSAGRWVAFLALAARPEAAERGRSEFVEGPAEVRSVLRQLTRGVGADDWIIARLSKGEQATAYVVRERDRQPVWPSHAMLVIKIFEPAASPSLEFVRRQFDALARLHAALHDCAIAEWRIFVPAPIYLCPSPLAIVMTLVDGRKLEACLENEREMTPGAMESAARALVAAMQRYWRINSQPHGDLNLSNILCDPAKRHLSFVDPGESEIRSRLDDGLKGLSPASLDLGYMLYATVTAVKRNIGRFDAATRKRGFVELVLRSFLDGLGPAEAKRRALDEIEFCAKAYLRELELSWSPRGLWRTFIKTSASRQIEALMRRLRAEADDASLVFSRSQEA